MGFIILIDLAFNVFVVLVVHSITNMFGFIIIGILLFTSCYIYLSAFRVLLFGVFIESSIILMILILYNLDCYCLLNIKFLVLSQWYVNNIMNIGIVCGVLFIIIILLDGMKLPFDYLECDSELVAGVITEFSGLFFMVFSLLEISHMLMANLLYICFVYGGL